MRQVQELSISLTLSTVSGVLLVVTILLGSASVWRDVEQRYTSSILTLPVSRSQYLLSKFVSIGLFLLLCTFILGAFSAVIIVLTSSTYPSETPIHWHNITLVLLGDFLKYLLLASAALLLSSVSTSFYLPFFGTLVIYLCGNASQEVYEYATGEFGKELSLLAVKAVTAVYYVIPNLTAFDFQIQAVYGLAVPWTDFLFSILYALVYTSILLTLAVLAFGRRQLP